jgi:hypothetical protein
MACFTEVSPKETNDKCTNMQRMANSLIRISNIPQQHYETTLTKIIPVLDALLHCFIFNISVRSAYYTTEVCSKIN